MTTSATPESETGSPLRELVRHTLVYGSGYITMAVASFLLVPVYTHHLSPSAYGILGLMLVLYGVMTQVYDLGFTNSVGRFSRRARSIASASAPRTVKRSIPSTSRRGMP